MLPDALRAALEEYLGDPIEEHASVGGGCIANGCRIETDTRSYFLKWGDASVARTFPGEAVGLEALSAAASAIEVPTVVHHAPPTDDTPGFLLMQWINSGRKGLDFWSTFGEELAALHRHTHDQYGFAASNFIGRLPQDNTWTAPWPSFFRKRRLAPQVQMAQERGYWRPEWDPALRTLYQRLPDLLPAHPPASVLHGDLWSGNFMVTAIGVPALIDPAVYYGHRETDVAMTELFGGFDASFYDAYRRAWALEPGYEKRRDIYNLYHLINHLNHFGARYAAQVDGVLQHFR